MAQSLEEQLAEVFSRGLEADPEARASLAEALSSSLADEKATKAEANYRKAEPHASERCSTCEHFNEGRCDVVGGVIDAAHVSDFFEPVEETDAGSDVGT